MNNNILYFLSGLRFVFLGSLISGFGLGGVVLLGKMTGALTHGTTSLLIQIVFIFIYGTYLIALCWLTGKYIVPKYSNK